MKRKLYLSRDTFEHLHELTESKKGRVTVARQYLVNLLMDYSIMLEMVKGRVEEPSNRERPHLNEEPDSLN